MTGTAKILRRDEQALTEKSSPHFLPALRGGH